MQPYREPTRGSYFESQRIYDIGEQFHAGGVPEGYYESDREPDIKKAEKTLPCLP